jgi:cytochrome c oxidase cbb3-type subunit III
MLVLAFVCAAGTYFARSQAQSQDRWEEDFRPDSAQGRRIFAATCAGCHGLDGHGGEKAPSIVGEKLQRLSNTDMAAIVSNGVPGTGMPAFHSLSVLDIHAVVDYVRNLQGQSKSHQNTAIKLPGDPVRGRTVFFGKAECSSCHMVRGEGGFLGSDLSTYASNIPVKEVIEAIVNPQIESDSSSGIAVATTRDGRRIPGLVRNEDNFSVQLQTSDGAFHFFLRSELQSFDYQNRPMMPSNYGERLNRSELNDLASYLVSVGQREKPPVATNKDKRH